MHRVLLMLLVTSLIPTFGGCDGPSPPPATGEPFTPPPQLDEMKNQMIEAHKKGTVGKYPTPSSTP
jgi:hypothetical protein